MSRLLFLIAMVFCVPAYAHVTANPDTGMAGQYFETKFRISHGCEGSDTTAVHIMMPKGLVTVTPQFKTGWKIDVKKSKLAKPVPAGHGKIADMQFDEISWTGGPLPDDEYDEFGLIIKLPEGADQTLWFPVTQTCVKGENVWNEIPKAGQQWHDLKSPAPFVKVQRAGAMEGMAGMNHSH